MERIEAYQIIRPTIIAFCVLLAAVPGVCFSPQPPEKPAKGPADFRQAGLNRDRTQLPALLAALKKPDDPFEHFSALAALHALAQMGATEALPAIDALTSASHDADLVNFAAAAQARLLAESGAQTIKDPKARARAKLATLYLATKLGPDALNLAAKAYLPRVGNPGEPVPLGVCVMRQAADVLYQEGVASSAVETTPPDYSLDPASALKVQLAPLAPKNRINALVEQLASEKITQPAEAYAIQLLSDMDVAAEQAIDAKVVDMDMHQEEYDTGGFTALFDALRGIGDPSQSSFVERFASDPSRTARYPAERVLADIQRGNQALFATGY